MATMRAARALPPRSINGMWLAFAIHGADVCGVCYTACSGGILSPKAQFVTASFEPYPADGWCPWSPADCLELLGIGDHSLANYQKKGGR